MYIYRNIYKTYIQIYPNLCQNIYPNVYPNIVEFKYGVIKILGFSCPFSVISYLNGNGNVLHKGYALTDCFS